MYIEVVIVHLNHSSCPYQSQRDPDDSSTGWLDRSYPYIILYYRWQAQMEEYEAALYCN